MTRFVSVFLLALLLVAGCVSPRGRIAPVTLDQLRDFREAQLAERLRAHLVVTVSDPRVRKLESAANADVLLQQLIAAGRLMGDSAGVRLVEHYPIEALGVYVYVFAGDVVDTVEQAAEQLAEWPNVQRVQRVNLFRTRSSQAGSETANPNALEDPLAPLQAIPPATLARLHALATGQGVSIAIVDTGIDLAHEDLAGARLVARNLVDADTAVPVETHATAITGLVLAQVSNSAGIRGIAPDARVIVLRACWQQTSTEPAYCNTFTLAKALVAALEADVDIVNLSLTGPMDPLLVQLVEELQANNVIVVGAYPDEPGQGPFPATLPGVIAATSRLVLARDPGPVFAPGDDVITLLPEDRYGLADGSSVSAAQVTGVASLFRDRDPSISAQALEALLHGRGVREEGFAGLLEALRATGE